MQMSEGIKVLISFTFLKLQIKMTDTEKPKADEQLDVGVWNKSPVKENQEIEVPVRKVYVSNIHSNTKTTELIEFFTKFGPVKEAYIRSGRKTVKRSQYFAFVTFETTEAAEKALSARRSNLKLRERILNVHPANIKHQPDKGPDPEVSIKEKYGSVMERTGTLEDFEPEDDGYMKRVRPCKINDLNDDCFSHIFSFLNVREKIAYELVCKRWRSILLDQWNRVTTLDCNTITEVGQLNDAILGKILQRCGNSIVRLELPVTHSLSGDAMHLITCLSKSLEHLSAHGLRMTTSACKLFTVRCRHMKSIILREPVSIRDQDIKLMFDRFRLESFCLTQRTIDGISMAHLPPTLKHLDLTSCNDMNMNHLVAGLSRTPGLRSIKFDLCANLTKTDFESVCSKVPFIEELSLVNYFPNLNRAALNQIHLLTNLRKLDFSMNSLVDDALITSISMHCKHLEILDVSGCYADTKVSDESIKAVAKNSNVIDLSISYLASVTDESLFALAEAGKLKRLRCLGSPSITDEGTSRLISLCLELEFLDVSGCDNITSATSDMAVKTLSLRPDTKRLHLIIGGTSVTEREIPVPNHSLKVSLVNNCIDRFKPNFNHDELLYFDDDDCFDIEDDEDLDDDYGYDYDSETDSIDIDYYFQ